MIDLDTISTKFSYTGRAALFEAKPLIEYADHMRQIPAGDLPVYMMHVIKNWYFMLRLVQRVGLVKITRGLLKYPWLFQLLRINRAMRLIVRGRSGLYLKSICMTVNVLAETMCEMLEDVFNHPEKLVISEEMIPTDITRAMGLGTWMLEMLNILIPTFNSEFALKYIDEAENAGINPDACSLPKATVGMALRKETPPGAAMISANLPCDAGTMSYTQIQKEYGLPIYRLDVPHHFYNERAEKLFADDLRGMIAFLEQHTPGRMDWGKFKEICEARNRMLELELELWELISSRPAPLAAEAVTLSHLWLYNAFAGHEAGVRHFENLVSMARKNLSTNIPATKNERYRALLWNPQFPQFADILNKAERKYGITVINDSMTFHRHEPIDTSSPDSMLRGLANIIMQGPMIRHTRGPAANYLDDIFRMRRQFKIDMLWVSNHVGCKSGQGMNGILREKCRQEKLPLLIIDYDLLDPRIVSHNAMMSQLDFFMKNVMKAQRLEN